jgi:nicotinamide riboside transporter PnuC
MLQKTKDFIKSHLFLCTLITVTFIAILTTGILFGQKAWRMLPLFISLAVMLLQACVNRYAYLLGGLNSILYAIAFFSMGIRESAISALLISFPLQVVTFILWQRKTQNNETSLRRLKLPTILGIALAYAISWAVLFFFFPHDTNASTLTIIMDTTVTLLGFITTVLTLLRFREYVLTQLLTAPLNLTMYIMMMVEGKTENITYVIYTVYTMICITMAMLRIKKKTVEE